MKFNIYRILTCCAAVFVFVFMVSFFSNYNEQVENDGQLYHLELSDPSSFSVSCADQLNSKWRIENKVCSLETQSITLPMGTNPSSMLDIPVSLNLAGSGNLENNDGYILEYATDNTWKTIEKKEGTVIPKEYTYFTYLVKNIPSGTDISFRLILMTNEPGERITLQCNDSTDFCVGTPFYAGTGKKFIGIPEPVTLSDFTGTISEGKILLQWETLKEFNNDYFTLERSINGIDFVTIGKINSSGNINEKNSYSIIDSVNSHPTIYYRLSQTAFNHKTEYCDIIAVSENIPSGTHKGTQIYLTPEPCLGKCIITLNKKNASDSCVNFTIIDALGNVVNASLSKNSGDSSSFFSFDDKNGLNPGIYIIKGTNKNL